MIILFAPAKTFKYEDSFQLATLRFKLKTQTLVDTIRKWNQEQIKLNFKISEQLCAEVKAYFENFNSGPSYQAFQLYHGVSYQSLDFNTLTSEQQQRLHKQTYVIDALYGIIKPCDYIKPYRLDFNTKSLGLRPYWKKEINTFLSALDEPILSLTSTEFSNLVDVRNPVYEVSFIDCKQHKCKAISVFNKQNRGALLRFLITENILSIKDLPNTFNGYVKEIEDKKIIYRRVSNE